MVARIGESATSSNSASVRGGIDERGRAARSARAPRRAAARPRGRGAAAASTSRRTMRPPGPAALDQRAGRRRTARRSSARAARPSRARPRGRRGGRRAGARRHRHDRGRGGRRTGSVSMAGTAGPAPRRRGGGAAAGAGGGAAARRRRRRGRPALEMSSSGSAMTPISSPTGTVPPSPTRILRRTPAPKASISTLALSVSISAMMSPPLIAVAFLLQPLDDLAGLHRLGQLRHQHLGDHALSTPCRIGRGDLAPSTGVFSSSRLRAYGMGAFSPVTRSTGASRSSKALSVIEGRDLRAHAREARARLEHHARGGSSGPSRGWSRCPAAASVRGSTISTEMPSLASSSAASRARYIMPM